MSATEMQAGRELDALVAERVMGERWIGAARGASRIWQKIGSAKMQAEDADVIERNGYEGVVLAPPYSTDIAATWQVVEKMKDHPHVNRRALQLVAWEYGRTYAAFSNESPDFGLVTWSEGSGPHATPLAICRAALAAVDQ